MRLHRFYIREDIDDTQITITDTDLVHQWKNVFRYQVGTQVIVFTGDGYDYLCMIVELHTSRSVLEITSRRKSILPSRTIGLIIALTKKDTLEFIVQKATELGVSDIYPVQAERSEKKSFNSARLEKIAIEAAEQSGRGDIPHVHPLQTFEKILENELLTIKFIPV